VVNADDFGVSRGTTLGIIKAHREGIVTSASMCVTTPHYEFAVEQARTCPNLGVGLHFTLTSGRPVSHPRLVPLLVNESGYFNGRFLSLWLASVGPNRRELLAEIEQELVAQFERLESSGIKPDHVDSERHVHLIPGIFDCVARVAETRVHFVRAAPDLGAMLFQPRDAAPLTLSGGIVKWGLLSMLASRARRRRKYDMTADRFVSYLYTGRTNSFLPRLLASPPQPGITEVMVHPAIPSEDTSVSLGNRELEHYITSSDRTTELQACLDARGHTGAWQLTSFGKTYTEHRVRI